MKRRFTLLAVATFLSTTLLAAWEGGTSPFSGSGTEGDPYLIASEENLAYLASQVNSGTSYSGKHFIQTEDLDLGGVQDENGVWSGRQWIPIGNNSNPFSGIYDGNGKVINNLYYNNPANEYVGLFGYILGATITNVTIASGCLFGYQETAGICGAAYSSSTISYCANNATVYGKMEQNGGVCGYLENSTVTDCINYGLVSGFNFSGGVVGRCKKNTKNIIIRCINVGQVFGMRVTTGNLIGYNDDLGATIKTCFYDNQINASSGVTSSKTATVGDTDRPGRFLGKATSEIIGSYLSDSLGETHWVFSNNMYPRLRKSANNSAIIVAATPVLLSSGDKADNVTQNFSVITNNNIVNNSVSWQSGNTSSLTISGETTSILKSTAIVLIAEKDGYKKKIYLRTNKNGATPIGSNTSPITIESESELKQFRDAVNNYGTYKGCANYDGFKGIHFKVTVDIALSDWTEPIGVHNSFKGIFDGNNRSISGINTDQMSDGIAIVGGLFGCASYGEIKNITLQSGTVSGIQFVGGICGSTYSETLTNCTSYCSINIGSNKYAGGIVGTDKGYSTLANCVNRGSISGADCIGGIMGTSNMSSSFSNCINYGTINCSTQKAAGICGNATDGCQFENCENHGNVTATGISVGGIIGITGTVKNLPVTNCINSGNIIGSQHVGGIGGQIIGTATIENCLNLGSITSSTSNAGGISGLAKSGVIISNCFNAGKITATSSRGGILGSVTSSEKISSCINIGVSNTAIASAGTISKCFHDKQFTLIAGGTTGKKTSEMTGDALKSTLGEESWTFTNRMYPMIKSLENSQYMIIAATALILDGADNINNVNTNFTYNKDIDVKWTCNYPQYVSFANGTGFLTYYEGNEAPAGLTVTINNIRDAGDPEISKTIPMTINPKEEKDSPGASFSISPNEIVYGTEITEGMYITSVSTDCEGEWEYSIAIGSKPHVDTYEVTATFIPTGEDATRYKVQTITADLTVTKKEPTIVWNPEDITYGAGDSDSKIKNAVAKDGDVVLNGTFSYNIPVLTPGEKTVTVTFSNADYAITTISAEKNTRKTITVSAATPSLAWSEPVPIEFITPLSSLQLGAVSGVQGNFAYYCKVAGEPDNTYQAIEIGDELQIGSYTLKAVFTPLSANYESGNFLTVPLVVTKATPVITWSNPLDITYGTALTNTQLNASANVPGTYAYTYNGNNAEGAIPVAGDNQAISVTFTPTDQIHYTTASAEVHINVGKANPDFTWTTPNIPYGTALTKNMLDAQLETNSNGETSYFIDNECNNTAIGHTFGAIGNNIVYVQIAETSNYAQKIQAVSVNITQAELDLSWTPQDITYGATSDEITSNLKNAQISFNDQNIEGSTVYDIPNPLNAGEQTIKVSFVPSSSNYKPIIDSSRTINVAKATPVVTWENPTTIDYGTTLSETQLSASVNVDASIGSITYSENDSPIVIGDVLSAGNHTITATFAPNAQNSGNYNPASTTAVINVGKTTPTITWSGPIAITFGTTLSETQLSASVNVDASIGSITYSENGSPIVIGDVLSAGNHTITATFAPNALNNGNYNSTSTTVVINVAKATPTITWSNPADIEYGTLLSGTQLNATTDVAGSFSYSPEAGTKLNAGNNQSLTATFTPTDNNYNPTSASVTINVAKATPTITWSNPADIEYGTLLSGTQLNATADAAGSFSYSPAAGTKLNAGNNQSLTATFTPTDNNYESATATVKINVAKAEPVITWSNPADIEYGTLLSGTQLNATADAAGSFSYSPAAGTKLNAGNNQTLTATFTPTDNNYESATATVKINVAKAEPVITWNNPDDIVYGTALSGAQLNAESDAAGSFSYNPAAGTKLNAGNNQTLTATFNPTDKNYKSSVVSVKINVSQAEPTITWNNPDDIVYGTALSAVQLNAEVDAAGKLTYSPAAKTKLNAGDNQTLTVTFAPTDTKNYKPASASVTINVAQAEPVITWEKPADIVYGTALTGKQLNAEVNAAGKFTYSPSVGTKLNAGNDQTLTATFVPNDTKNYTTVSAEVKINVAKADAIITWNAPADIVYGTALTNSMLNATANVLGTFEYTPAADAILNAGVQELSAVFTPADTANYNTASVSVQIGVAKADPVLAWSKPSDIVYGTPLADSMLNATANVLGDFEYTPAADAILNAGAQTLSAVFTPADTANYNSASTAVEIFVAKANPEIVWNNPSDIVYGTPIADSMLNASANVLGGFEYTPAADAILNAGTQELSAVFTPADTANYNSASATVEIVVAKANPEIVWNNPNDIVYGTALTDSILNATANVLGNFEYTPAADAILNAGIHELSVVFTPADTANYYPASATAQIVVEKAEPIITWSEPNSIVYGTVLADSMLNATTDVEGVLTYMKPTDSVLKAGDYPIIAMFIAADSNYMAASDTTTLTVTKATLTVTAINDTIVIGSELPEFQIAYSGFVFGDDTSSLTTLATATCNVPADSIGTFEIKVSGGEADNYTFEYVSGNLTVIDVPVVPVITWSVPKSNIYGRPIDSMYLCATADYDGRFEYSARRVIETNPLQLEDTIRSLNIGDTLTPAGYYYYLYATFYPADSTVMIVRDTNSILVHKASLTVAVADVTINQGDEMPEFAISYNGFVFDENESNLNTVPVATCNADTNEAGTYEIVVSGGESANYDFNYVNGTLTVKAKDDTTAIAETEVTLMAYPNPTNGMFVVETNSSVEYIYVYNAVGKLVATEMNTGTTRFNLTNEPEGTYFVKVGEKTIKLMKF